MSYILYSELTKINCLLSIILCYMLKYARILYLIINNINLVMQKNIKLSIYFELFFDNFKKIYS